MIRVGFRLIGGAGWQGGRNYLWNLLHAVTSLPAQEIQPVLLVRSDEDPGDLVRDGVERFDTSSVLDSPRTRRIGGLLRLATGRNPVETAWLRRARIDVVSHAMPVGRTIPAISWIPDVQHRHLPHMFSRRERLMRDLSFREILRRATLVVTSSETARDDLRRFYGLDESRCRVLRFVSQPRLGERLPLSIGELQQRLGVPAKFFHLPNQMWKHKNHALVVEALRHAPEAVVVATGPREDYRHAGVYDSLMAQVRAHGLEERFLHLGLVSFHELASLMHHAVAIINPSRFEGWSTTVEEAKSLGKRVLVSDIPVHREQAPARGRLFPVDDPRALGALMVETWSTEDRAAEARAMAEAASALPERTRAFGEAYASIVADAVRRGGRTPS